MLSLKLLLALLPAVFAAPNPRSKDPDVVEGKYIITLKPKIVEVQIEHHLSWVEDTHKRSLHRRDENGVEKIWSDNFKGYSGEFDKETIKEIKASDDVIAVEPVRKFELYQQVITQSPAPWGLGSISHRTPNWHEYRYDNSSGNGTWAYVLDTGVNCNHTQFEGRAHLGYNALPHTEFIDANGHGTHCAGTIASREFGVAKNASVIAVKVFHDSGSTTDVILDGFEWAVTNITNTPGRAQNSVVSMSLGGGRSPAFNAAIENAYRAGILTVVAAGNEEKDARDVSPASAPNAITVAAVDRNNVRASWSNYGAVVDIFAAGVDVVSTWIGTDTAVETISGTSMACPHVAGLALYLMALEKLPTPADVTKRIKSLGTKNVVANRGTGSPNLLAFNGVPEPSKLSKTG
ncbi:hypothetical protein Neosp_011904 [[Neocosmospora] mangrovei]